MPLSDYLLAALVAVGVGLDRTAAFQFMISRPIVAAPLAGWVLGEPLIGLQAGALSELLWLGRLPVGAAIPPDDTQVAVGATVLAVFLAEPVGLTGFPLVILCLLTAMPLGKAGQLFDRLARNRNGRLLLRAESAVREGRLHQIERHHLLGLGHFAAASLSTFLVITGGGWLVLTLVAPLIAGALAECANWLWLAFPVVGSAVILGTINVSRSLTLFSASFVTALLMLWLV